MSEANHVATEQPRDDAGRFRPAEGNAELAAVTEELGKMRMDKVLDLASPDQHKVYEEAHAKSQAAQARKAKQGPIDLDEKLRQLKLRELGLGSLDDDIPAEDWVKNRQAQLRAGTVPRLTPVDESGEPIPEPEPEPTPDPAIAEAAASLGLPADHAHFERMKALHSYYGPEEILRMMEPAYRAGVQPTPGLARALAEFPNSGEMLLWLGGNPDAIKGLNATMPSKVKGELEVLSRWLETGTSEQPETKEPKQRKPAPPEPVTARASNGFDPNDDGMSPDEWARRRNESLRARRGW